jgi:hypothetical protein
MAKVLGDSFAGRPLGPPKILATPAEPISLNPTFRMSLKANFRFSSPHVVA